MIRLLLPLLLSAAASSGAAGQDPAGQDQAGQNPAAAAADTAGGWDAARPLELLERARARRLLPAQDTSLRNYTARAEGFVYFYLDRRETEDRTLVKTDQVAIELFWAQPNRTKQRIVGLRDESRLPNRMYYHLDHLTVVQNTFGDVIRMGDGDEVDDVLHPAAGGSGAVYQFRLADSLTLSLPGAPEIRVYEVQVRPRRTDRPALVGSIFIDRATADIVRMTFTFTPVSYVDRRLDQITVSLDNGLWEGRYWLPHEQTLLIRRQLPELDFAASAVIHGRMRIRDYEFNDSIPPGTFLGPTVTAAPEAERRAFSFDNEIYSDLNSAGLEPTGDLATVRDEAFELLGRRALSGLPSLRLSLSSASSLLRYNRAEGVAAGAGLTYTRGPAWRIDANAGWAFGPDHPWGTASLRRMRGADATLRILLNERQDLGIRPAQPEAINTLVSAFGGRDLLDLYYTSGARLLVRHPFRDDIAGEFELLGERHRSARRTQEHSIFSDDATFRDVLAVDGGDISAFAIGLRRPVIDARATSLSGLARIEVGAYDDGAFVRPTLDATWRLASPSHEKYLLLQGAAGIVAGEPPSQRLFLLGGQNTLPGYGHRRFAGRRFALVNIEAGTALWQPWLGVHVVGAAGTAAGLRWPNQGITNGSVLPRDEQAWTTWNRSGTDGIRTSAGAGVSLFWDLLRLEAVRGLNGGGWQYMVSFHRDFWDIG